MASSVAQAWDKDACLRILASMEKLGLMNSVHLVDLYAMCEQHEYAEGDVMMQKGESEDFVAFVLQGTLGLDLGGADLKTFPAPAVVGETGLRLEGVRTATIVAASPSVHALLLRRPGALSLSTLPGSPFDQTFKHWLKDPSRSASSHSRADALLKLEAESTAIAAELVEVRLIFYFPLQFITEYSINLIILFNDYISSRRRPGVRRT